MYIVVHQSREMINKKLYGIRYPQEFPRTQKKISTYNTYKATELRNLFFYVGIICFDGILKEKYYDHFMTFIPAIRLLTQEKIEKKYIEEARALINSFCLRFNHFMGQSITHSNCIF